MGHRRSEVGQEVKLQTAFSVTVLNHAEPPLGASFYSLWCQVPRPFVSLNHRMLVTRGCSSGPKPQSAPSWACFLIPAILRTRQAEVDTT